jgi:hypothetical protein
MKKAAKAIATSPGGSHFSAMVTTVMTPIAAAKR